MHIELNNVITVYSICCMCGLCACECLVHTRTFTCNLLHVHVHTCLFVGSCLATKVVIG